MFYILKILPDLSYISQNDLHLLSMEFHGTLLINWGCQRYIFLDHKECNLSRII